MTQWQRWLLAHNVRLLSKHLTENLDSFLHFRLFTHTALSAHTRYHHETFFIRLTSSPQFARKVTRHGKRSYPLQQVSCNTLRASDNDTDCVTADIQSLTTAAKEAERAEQAELIASVHKIGSKHKLSSSANQYLCARLATPRRSMSF